VMLTRANQESQGGLAPAVSPADAGTRVPDRTFIPNEEVERFSGG
jgi:hypothetical protein